MYNQYITPEDYETAKRNGIKRITLESRVREYGWEIERAITEKPKKRRPFKPIWDKWRSVASENGVGRDLFYQRVRKNGMSEEDAANTPPGRGGRQRSRWSDEEVRIATENGVAGNGMSLPNARVTLLGWSREDAISTPKVSEEERAKRVAEGTRKYRERMTNSEFNKKFGNG